ncbi:MAG: RnfH family protein [Aeromonadaceae bacterium]
MVDMTRVEVVYALPLKQHSVQLTWMPGMTLGSAIAQSGLLQRFPELELDKLKVGVYSRLLPLDAQLQGGERIEIYRPLTADPREMRRKRADKAKDEGRADKVTGGRVNPERKQL